MTVRTWKFWTRKEEGILVELRSQGKDIPQIAQEMGRSYSSIKGRLELLEAPKANDRRLDWLYALTSGMTERQIAARMGVGKSAVKRYKQRLKGK